jgi:hypothetical protein
MKINQKFLNIAMAFFFNTQDYRENTINTNKNYLFIKISFVDFYSLLLN